MKNSALEDLVRERTRALDESQKLYRLLTEDTLDVIWKTDRKLCITYISPSDERLRGYKAEEVIGHHVFEMFTPEGVATVERFLAQRVSSIESSTHAGFKTFEVQHRCKDGRVLWGEVLSKPEFDERGEIVGFHGITREISDRKRLEDQVHQLAFNDALTGLPNRRLLLDRLNQTMSASKRSSNFGALMFLDLDNFKPLNDSHGHGMGDQLLIEVARRLKGCVREVDTVARFGGDEFVILLGELSVGHSESIDEARRVAEKIRNCVAEPYLLNATLQNGSKDATVEHQCTACIGVVMFIDHEIDQSEILKRADAAMYQAKESGRNRVNFYTPHE